MSLSCIFLKFLKIISKNISVISKIISKNVTIVYIDFNIKELAFIFVKENFNQDCKYLFKNRYCEAQ